MPNLQMLSRNVNACAKKTMICGNDWNFHWSKRRLNQMPTSVEFNSTVATVTSKSSSDEKVKLFRSLFRGREDVYAARWEGRNGKGGLFASASKNMEQFVPKAAR
jgi:hypothetical protein